MALYENIIFTFFLLIFSILSFEILLSVIIVCISDIDPRFANELIPTLEESATKYAWSADLIMADLTIKSLKLGYVRRISEEIPAVARNNLLA